MGQLEEIHQLEKAIDRNQGNSLLVFYKVELARARYLTKDYRSALEVLEPLRIAFEAKLVRDACLARLGELSDAEREANRNSDVRIDQVRMRSSMEDRDQLDFWAQGLRLVGYRS